MCALTIEVIHFNSRVCEYESDNKMNLGSLSVIWAMTLFHPENMLAPPLIPPAIAETSDAKNAPPQSLQSATSVSMLQTTVLSTIFDAYANGKLDLPTYRSDF